MTDEHTDMVPEEPAQPEATNTGEFTTGAGLVVLAAFVVLAVWVIFDLLTDNYGVTTTVVVLAATAVILPRLNRESVERFFPLSSLMKVLGYAIALFGVTEFLIDLDVAIWDDVLRVVGALAAYAGYVMAFIGARQID